MQDEAFIRRYPQTLRRDFFVTQRFVGNCIMRSPVVLTAGAPAQPTERPSTHNLIIYSSLARGRDSFFRYTASFLGSFRKAHMMGTLFMKQGKGSGVKSSRARSRLEQ